MKHPGLASEDAVTSSYPTAIAEIRRGVSVWRLKLLCAGTGIIHAFRDEVRFPDGPGLYTAQPDIFVVFAEAPGVNTDRFFRDAAGLELTMLDFSQTKPEDHG